MIYVIFILLASVGVSALVWADIKGNSIDEERYNNYLEYKNDLIKNESYDTFIEEVDISVSVRESNDAYLVSTTFSNPDNNYTNLIILVVDQSEKEKKTDKIYPSIGIVGDFNNEFVVNAPNKKTTHSKLTMNYESDVVSQGVLISVILELLSPMQFLIFNHDI